MPDDSQLSPRQAKWFQSVRTGLESATGLTIEQWAEIARTCPEQAHRKRLAWMKTHHGLGQNHASIVFDVAFPATNGWSEPDNLAARLWSDPDRARVFAAIKTMVTGLCDVVVGQRKSYTAFSRQFQFAAARPHKAGGLVLGLAVEPQTQKNLAERGRESWSERLRSSVEITSGNQIDETLRDMLQQAWDHS